MPYREVAKWYDEVKLPQLPGTQAMLVWGENKAELRQSMVSGSLTEWR